MYAKTVSVGTPGEQPEFELPGRTAGGPAQCAVFPWGINWSEKGEHHSARWGDIVSVEEGHDIDFVIKGGTTYTPSHTHFCRVYLKGRPGVTFYQTLMIPVSMALTTSARVKDRLPVAWTNLKPVPGVTKRVNIQQLARLISHRARVKKVNQGLSRR